jgi:hypothetical protein
VGAAFCGRTTVAANSLRPPFDRAALVEREVRLADCTSAATIHIAQNMPRDLPELLRQTADFLLATALIGRNSENLPNPFTFSCVAIRPFL